MRAVWYERQGRSDVLQVGELPDPQPAAGEVQVRVAYSGVNPGDTKKREDHFGYGMAYPRVIPHSDGAGVITTVGEGVESSRVGRPVWVFGAQSYRPSGTAAEFVCVPDWMAVSLPDGVDRIIEVALSVNVALDAAVAANGAVIASYATITDPTPIPFWQLLFQNVTLRMCGSDDFPREAKLAGVAELNAAAAAGALRPSIAAVLPLERCAEAHDLVDAGARGRVLLRLTDA